MSWNYRMMRHVDPVLGDEFLEIHEVYYDPDGRPDGYTEEPVSVGGENIEEIGRVLDMMREALGKPVLTQEDCGGG